ncbi:hypothetical protein LC087_03385 [Bacillus carboniphilus]|uniref:Uncharacterized protein n=1 Tax=Bacillus carboniphilus TaxID=86663 RepID=A0ABY9JV21_9BACI|nr:hypothetical protein [Bacillus carboniphilus]WLR43251.1 hypothetical protein LC087_03385 [Bacillus carboniphilus]
MSNEFNWMNFNSQALVVLTENEDQFVVSGTTQVQPTGALSGVFLVVDIQTGDIITQITINNEIAEPIYDIVLSLDGNYLYVTTEEPQCIFYNFYVFDTSNWGQITSIRLKDSSEFSSTTPGLIRQITEGEEDNIIFASYKDNSTGYLYEISRCGDTFNSVTNISISNSGAFYSISSDGSTIVVANQDGNSVSFIETSTLTEEFTLLNTGTGPQVLVVD